MNQISQFIEELNHLQISYKLNQSLKDYTTLHIGGNVSLIIEPKTKKEIEISLKKIKQYHIPFEVLGNGSNILALDQGYQGVILVLPTYFHQIDLVDKHIVKGQSGASLKDLCDFCLKEGLTGLEFACGIPGSIGGAIVMNAGAYGGEMKDVVKSVTYLDEDFHFITLNRNQLNFGYRHSYFSDHQGIIVEVEFELEEGNKEEIQTKMEELMARRYAKQPMDEYSAGSTFKRPKGHYASALIKEADLQGFHVNDASVSIKHAGFLINEGHATSQDFLLLIEKVKERVYQTSGVHLSCEIKILDSLKH